jgi:Ca-activated chloride channel homolog
MKFIWPQFLWALILIPALVWLYWWVLNRRKKIAIQYANLALVREAMGTQSSWRRHLPPALFLLAIASMLFATSRPAALMTLPTQHETVVMAMDVSGSMRAKDVEPNRMVASQNAAKSFVNDQPKTTRIGLVTFAATASLVQPPTRSKEDLVEAIDRFQLQRGTAVGSGILVSLKTLFPEMEIDLRGFGPRSGGQSGGQSGGRNKANAAPLAAPGAEAKEAFKPVPPGSYKSGVIVLLTDGQTTTGADPIEAAKEAANRGVRVYTVGFGTANGEIIGAEGWSMRVRLDEETLKQIANITHGEYFYAGSAMDLTKVYETLNSRLVFEKKETEITAFFAAAGALLSVLAAALSLLWFNRLM